MFIKPKTDVFSLKMGHDKDALVRPLRFVKVWSTDDWPKREWKSEKVTIWRLFCPHGYVALGHLGHTPGVYPSANTVWCVKKEYTKLDYDPRRIYTDFAGWEPFGRSYPVKRNKMISVWQSQQTCKDSYCSFSG